METKTDLTSGKGTTVRTNYSSWLQKGWKRRRCVPGRTAEGRKAAKSGSHLSNGKENTSRHCLRLLKGLSGNWEGRCGFGGISENKQEEKELFRVSAPLPCPELIFSMFFC